MFIREGDGMMNRTNLFCLLTLMAGAAVANDLSSESRLGFIAPYGIAKPREMAILRFGINGQIAEVLVAEGVEVKAGTPLIRLEDALPQANLAAARLEARKVGSLNSAKSAWQLAESQYARFQKVLDRNAGSEFELLERRAALEQARAAYDREVEQQATAEVRLRVAEAEYSRYLLTAPFDGQIVQVHAKVGHSIDPSLSIVTIADVTVLEVEMHLPVTMYGTVHKGARLDLEFAEPISERIAGEVEYVSTVINAPSQSFRCLLRVDNGDRRLPGGAAVRLVP